MSSNLVAKAAIDIDATRDRVWKALVTPAEIKKYMFGTDAQSDWKVGSPIRWKGTWEGKAYEDKGTILSVRDGRLLQYTHFSPTSGLPDRPESYHTVTIELNDSGARTHVVLTQDNNPNDQAKEQSERNWAMMLSSLKKLLET
jgi:uncharacterized protein YndB with AHSA1/START domain